MHKYAPKLQGKLHASHSSEVNASINTKAAWKVLRYCNAPDTPLDDKTIPEGAVMVGARLKLKFPQIEDSYMVAIPGDNMVQVFFHVNRSEPHQDQSAHTFALSNAMWVLQQEFSHYGGYAQWDMTYHLRHYNTGYYLALDETPAAEAQKITMVENRHDALRLFLQRTSSKHHADHICYDKTVHVGCRNTVGDVQGWICQERELSTTVSFHASDTFKHGASFILEQEPDQLVFDAEISLVMSRMLEEVAHAVKRKVQTPVSSWSYVDGSTDNDMRQLLSRCCNSCLHLIYFAAECTDQYGVMLKKYPEFVQRARHFRDGLTANKPVPTRQVLFREQGVFSHCFTALLAVGDGLDKLGRMENATYHSYKEMLQTIGYVLYHLVKIGFEGHRQNETYLAQLRVAGANRAAKTTIDIMIEDHLDLEIGAADVLTSLFDNNKHLLETEISQERLDKFYEMVLSHGLRDMYLNFFAAVCGYDAAALQKNQVMVAQKLFVEDPPKSIFLETTVINPEVNQPE